LSLEQETKFHLLSICLGTLVHHCYLLLHHFFFFLFFLLLLLLPLLLLLLPAPLALILPLL